MKVLSLDQAKNTGYAVFEDGKLIESGIKVSKEKDYKEVIKEITSSVEFLIEYHRPDVVLLEDVQAQSNTKTHKDLSMLLGALYHVTLNGWTKCEIIHVSTWRSFLRKRYELKGRLDRTAWKKCSKKFVSEEYNLEVKDDEADAIAIGYYYINKRTSTKSL